MAVFMSRFFMLKKWRYMLTVFSMACFIYSEYALAVMDAESEEDGGAKQYFLTLKIWTLTFTGEHSKQIPTAQKSSSRQELKNNQNKINIVDQHWMNEMWGQAYVIGQPQAGCTD